MMDPSGDVDITVTGTTGFSTYRFQPVRRSYGFENDYRFSPADDDVEMFLYGRVNDVYTFTQIGTGYIRLEGAMESLKSSALAVVAASIVSSYLF